MFRKLFTMAACGKNDAVEYQEENIVEQSSADTEAVVTETTKEIESLEETEAEEAGLLELEQVTLEHLTQKTLPEEGAWLKETDQVSLVAAIEEKDIYLYCLHNGHPWGGKGVILQCENAYLSGGVRKADRKTCQWHVLQAVGESLPTVPVGRKAVSAK